MFQYIISEFTDNYVLNTVLTRSFFAFFLSLALSLCFGTKLINFLRATQGKGQPIREDGPQSHLLTKKGTPTMGGLLILGSSVISTLLFANLTNVFVWICIAVILIYGFTGFIDDYTKVKKQTANAMTAKMKLLIQFSTSFFAILLITHFTPEAYKFNLNFPYFANLSLNLWWFYVIFSMIVITGSSNAVNLTDGLDGLVSSLLILSFIFFASVAYICGSSLSFELSMSYIPEAIEVTVLCASVVGACLGFLWFNAHPAKVFMGDTGSLALGALLGTISIMLKSEILLAIVGGIYVLEAVSVMLQIAYFKKTGGKRLFKMAPLHHHFEQLGWKETSVVARFFIVTFALTALGFMSFFIHI